MKNTKYNDRYSSVRRRRTKKRAAKNSNLSFAVQLIALALVLYYIAFGVATTPAAPNVTAKTVAEEAPANQVIDEPVAISETAPAVPEAETEPVTIIDEDALPLEIHQIDVSCANAYLIRYDNFTIFVDGGHSFSYNDVIKYLDNFGVKSIDCYIATHWHGDHIANMNNLLRTYAHERTIVYGPSKTPNAKYPVPKGTYVQMLPGNSFEIGDVGLLCVGPDEVVINGNENPDSLNVLIQYKNFKFLITGDYMKDAVVEMFGELVKDIDVLQMPHHGLKHFCISEEAMLHCNPTTVLVPADSSKATRELVESLKLDANVLDNTNGCITLVSYGDSYKTYTNVTTPTDIQ